MRIGRSATAKETQGRKSADGVDGSGRNEHTIAFGYLTRLFPDRNHPRPFEKEIEFFRLFMVMGIGGLTGQKSGFCQTLVLHGRIRQIENAPNLRTVFCDKRFLAG